MLKLFITDWSTASKEFIKTLQTSEKFNGVEVINIEQEPEEARELGIKGIPALYNSSNGRYIIGAVTLEQASHIL